MVKHLNEETNSPGDVEERDVDSARRPFSRVGSALLTLVTLPLGLAAYHLAFNHALDGGWVSVLVSGLAAALLAAVFVSTWREKRRMLRKVGGTEQRDLLLAAIRIDGVLPDVARSERWRPEVVLRLRRLDPRRTVLFNTWLMTCVVVSSALSNGALGPVRLGIAGAVGLATGSGFAVLVNLIMKDRRENLRVLLHQIDARLASDANGAS